MEDSRVNGTRSTEEVFTVRECGRARSRAIIGEKGKLAASRATTSPPRQRPPLSRENSGRKGELQQPRSSAIFEQRKDQSPEHFSSDPRPIPSRSEFTRRSSRRGFRRRTQRGALFCDALGAPRPLATAPTFRARIDPDLRDSRPHCRGTHRTRFCPDHRYGVLGSPHHRCGSGEEHDPLSAERKFSIRADRRDSREHRGDRHSCAVLRWLSASAHCTAHFRSISRSTSTRLRSRRAASGIPIDEPPAGNLG